MGQSIQTGLAAPNPSGRKSSHVRPDVRSNFHLAIHTSKEIGLTLGIGGAFASTRLLQNQLFGVSRMDPVTIAVVAAVLLAIALAACFIPARRTTKLNPLLALGAE